MRADRERWDTLFKEKKLALGRRANPFLRRHVGLLPKGKALDVAAGEGRNAVFLALQGLKVDAVDISQVGLRKARTLAKEMGVRIHTVAADLDTYSIAGAEYDLITNFYFLDRNLIPRIRQGLRRGGRVVFETYLLEQRDLGVGGPTNPRYFLKQNELLRLFKGFRILVYREGIFTEDRRIKAVASLIAEKI
jgi:2-polyprenyl-3-methyl-5-hydroxy-6-metoxy-1,4-benzoquinol methylase